MSRTLKDMRGAIRERRRRPVLKREGARRGREMERASLTVGYLRRGRRKQERRLTEPTEKEETG